jgi:hypothetical protein
VTAADVWRRCSACKQSIALGAPYFVCSVSTCNRPRTGLIFCTVSCWEVHLPVARHREAWAEEQTAPRTPDAAAKPAGAPAAPAERAPRRILPTLAAKAAPAAAKAAPAAAKTAPAEVLIVASRLKDYVRARSGMNTSERVLEPLSEIVRQVCDEAIRNAERDGRKTVLDRDIPHRR